MNPDLPLNRRVVKELEKNHKVLRLLTGGLGDSDKRKVLSSLTTKEKWDALEKIHDGSKDVNTLDPRKEKAFLSGAWGESESDEEDYDKRGMTFVTSLDTHVSSSPK